MTWQMKSSTDPDRWLDSPSGIEFTADPQTTTELGDLAEHEVPAHPGGPMKVGVTTDVDLLVAAERIIPNPVVTGDVPQAETWPTLDGLLVY
ncbi:hypothetical protein CH302_01045 [Rhodococcus sp. 15-2388-1-1a]|uniref:hypothetical protein n=1 Tax=Nocardiaceae TaxID=85025 RepID=UPI0005616907|nr:MULTISPECIES: hypothetical protein [Rhodococcus]OZF05240.1 hypothetical protein CH302_01045 [Rhodococcus sp. 15-2388-1-1a]